MADLPVIEVFCEDRGHESIIVPLVRRALQIASLNAELRVVTAQGGAPRVWQELALTVKFVQAGRRVMPDLLVACLDANCTGHRSRTKEIFDCLGHAWDHRLVAACPEPHVERWYLADQDAFVSVVGGQKRSVGTKCQRGYYKEMLEQAVQEAGQISVSGGLDFGPDLAIAMDPYRLGKEDPAFADFWRSLTSAVRTLAQGQTTGSTG